MNKILQAKIQALANKNTGTLTKIESKKLFAKNLLFFQENIPNLYHDYKDYSFKQMEIKCSENSTIQLYDKNHHSIYPSNPRSFCEKQVNDYYKSPLSLAPCFSIMGGDSFYEGRTFDKIREYIKSNVGPFQPNINKPIGLMIVNGVGLGYHLLKLVDELEIFNIAIFDDSKDSFFASMHSIEWQKVISNFQQGGRSFHLSIGNRTEDNLTNIATIFQTISDFNRINVFCFNHLNYHSSLSNNFSYALLSNFKKTYMPLGFFEDERISFAHTIQNLKNSIPILGNKNRNTSTHPPALVIGNGPSLDKQIQFLKSHKNDCVIFACGSALSTLLNYNIVPDFYVLNERTMGTLYTTLSNLKKEHKEKIRFIALNAVYPGTFKIFDKSFMGLKSNDAGAYFVQHAFEDSYAFLNHCNPLAGNAGACFAANLGFSEIILLGMDLGMIDKRQHHASNSQYYNEEKSTFFGESSYKSDYTVAGNFRDSILADTTLIIASQKMSQLAKEFSHINFYNPNDGAKIDGIPAKTMNDLEKNITYPASLDKEIFLNELMSDYFTLPNEMDDVHLQKAIDKYIQPIHNFLGKVDLPEKPDSIFDIQRHLERIITNIRTLNKVHPLLSIFLTGSFSNFFSYLLFVSLAARTPAERQVHYHTIHCFLKDFIQHCQYLLSDKIFELDKR